MSNFLLHKHRKYDEHFQRPEGLNELISDLSREVLRAQPECIYTFLADYLEAMLITREQSLIAKHALTTVIDVSITIADLLHNVGISRQVAQKSSAIIENCIKDILVKEQPDPTKCVKLCECAIMERLRSELCFTGEQLCKAQRIIQVCFKDYYFREKEFKMEKSRLPETVWAACVEKTLDIYKNAGPQQWELDRAATAIQAAYRSHYTRRKLIEDRETLARNEQLIENIVSNAVDNIHERSGIIIQAAFRGHLVRRDMPANLEHLKTASRRNVSVEQVDPNDEAAATKIQAAYRGHLVRSGKEKGEESTPTEEYHVDPNDEEAATKIQAAYRGHLVRSGKEKGEESTPTEEYHVDPNDAAAATKIQAAYRGHLVRSGKEKGEESTPTEEDHVDPNDEAAATKIQAAYRGHLVRNDLAKSGKETGVDDTPTGEDHVDPNDEAAATKIQAAYRGHLVRNDLAKSGQETGEDIKQVPNEEDHVDPNDEAAATKIQAAYRGHLVRNDLAKSGKGDDIIEISSGGAEPDEIPVEAPTEFVPVQIKLEKVSEDIIEVANDTQNQAEPVEAPTEFVPVQIKLEKVSEDIIEVANDTPNQAEPDEEIAPVQIKIENEEY